MFANLDAPNSKSIVAQLLRLSQDPENQPVVAQEKGCLAGLVDYLRHLDQEVVLMAVRTLEFLSSHPQNKRLMKEFPGLLDALNETYSARAATTATATTTTTTDAIAQRTRELAARCLGNLGVIVQELRNDSWWGAPLWGEASVTLDEEENDQENRLPAPAANAGKNKYCTLTLRIDGLEENATAVVTQRVLVHVKGVISVNLDRVKGLAIVGTRGGDDELMDTLQEALTNAGITGSPWPAPQPPAVASATNNTNNLDSSLSSGGSSTGGGAVGGDDSGYLNESQYADSSTEGYTIAKWGASSLEARLAEQRREEELKAAKTEKLLSKVSSLVSNASSWLMGW